MLEIFNPRPIRLGKPKNRYWLTSVVSSSAGRICHWLTKVMRSITSPVSKTSMMSNHRSMNSRRPCYLNRYHPPRLKVRLSDPRDAQTAVTSFPLLCPGVVYNESDSCPTQKRQTLIVIFSPWSSTSDANHVNQSGPQYNGYL